MLRRQPSAPGRGALGQPCQSRYSSTAVYPVHAAVSDGRPDAGVRHTLSVRVSHLPPVSQTSSRLSRRLVLPVRPSATLSLHPSARRYVSASAPPAGGHQRTPPHTHTSPPPPPPADTVSGRVFVWGGGGRGGAARRNLSNVLNVTTVIRGGHNSQ